MVITVTYLSIIFIAIVVLIAYIICRQKGKKCLEHPLPKSTSITLAYKEGD